MSTWQERLIAQGSCIGGSKLLLRSKTYQELWDKLERGDWMMWALALGLDVDWSKLEAVIAEAPELYAHAPLAEKLKTWSRLADVVRRHFPNPPELPE